MQSINVDAFVGQRLFIFFNHNTPDGDVIYFDEMYVTEGNPTGIEELTSLSFNVFPNPSTGEFNVNLSSENSGDVNLTVKNVVGQTVINKSIAVSGKTRETISLANYSKGIYFLTIDNKTVKLIVE
ncbi:MAG: T9SS type A sorting domain-containing protein [Flavobacteriales bacterium]|nr:T9SS type A sorting domain-containing protein [Flavobacteriales bacterium]